MSDKAPNTQKVRFTAIKRYLELEPLVEYLVESYVLLTWRYNSFSAVPYLRFLGADPDTGKTRALYTIGSICYKPLFLAGSLTAASLYRVIDRYNGTMLIDEADFRNSDLWSDIIKILNAGFFNSGNQK